MNILSLKTAFDIDICTIMPVLSGHPSRCSDVNSTIYRGKQDHQKRESTSKTIVIETPTHYSIPVSLCLYLFFLFLSHFSRSFSRYTPLMMRSVDSFESLFVTLKHKKSIGHDRKRTSMRYSAGMYQDMDVTKNASSIG